ncbi:Immunoglobulin A1 protease autotransporter [Mannheimia haemolytica]
MFCPLLSGLTIFTICYVFPIVVIECLFCHQLMLEFAKFYFLDDKYMKPASFKLSLISAFVGLSLAQLSYSSTVRGDIDYQYFRDLAENKGKFYVGAKNVEIFNKQGDKIGIALENIPMIDFSVITRGGGYATLTKPQYIVSVEHNRGYRTVQFGDSGSENPDNHHFNYQLVSRNDYDPKGSKAIQGFTHNDYQTPRLHKLVTETAPAEQSQEKNYDLYRDASIFPMFIRAGSGTQYILAEKNAVKEKLADPYAYLIGGTTLKLTSNNANTFVFKGNVFDDSYSPLSSHPQQGDSGKTLTWTALGNSSRITGATAELVVDLADTSLPDPTTGKPHKPSLHHGKTLKISGDGNTLNLANNINQGAGALYFSGNAVVTGANEMTTWLGAGISVDKNKNVEWQVHNPVGDRLSKIGEGTLTVSGKGKNLGSISVGDGTVILNQQAGENGEKSAFSEVGIVSGRPTVILNSADQVDPNSIYFGYRGGRLDLNGNSLTFNRIQNVDDGARIVNNNAGTAANISLVGQVFTANDVRTINFGEGYNADLFRSQGAYFVLENNAWKFISWNHDDAKKYVVEKKNKALENQLYAYNGYFGESDSSRENGKLNIHFKPINAGGKLLLTGGTTLDGILSAENDAEIILSGRPIPYARQVLDENKKTINKEIIKEGEWINRTFSATTFQAKDNGKIEVSRNVVEVNGNFNLSDNATAQVGFTQGKSQSCVR